MSVVVLNAVTVDEEANLNAMLEELESLLMMHRGDAQTGTPEHHDIIDVIIENTPGMEDDRVVAIYEKLEAELMLVLVQPPEEQHSGFVHAAQGGWFHVLGVRETSWNMLPCGADWRPLACLVQTSTRRSTTALVTACVRAMSTYTKWSTCWPRSSMATDGSLPPRPTVAWRHRENVQEAARCLWHAPWSQSCVGQ